MKCGLCVIAYLTLTSCISYYDKSQINGYYAASGYKHTSDTIQLKSNSKYSHKIYDINNRIVLERNGKWELDNNRITLHGFFLNLDRNVVKYPDLLDNEGIEMNTILDTKNGTIRFCVGYDAKLDTNCYYKIKQ